MFHFFSESINIYRLFTRFTHSTHNASSIEIFSNSSSSNYQHINITGECLISRANANLQLCRFWDESHQEYHLKYKTILLLSFLHFQKTFPLTVSWFWGEFHPGFHQECHKTYKLLLKTSLYVVSNG